MKPESHREEILPPAPHEVHIDQIAMDALSDYLESIQEDIGTRKLNRKNMAVSFNTSLVQDLMMIHLTQVRENGERYISCSEDILDSIKLGHTVTFNKMKDDNVLLTIPRKDSQGEVIETERRISWFEALSYLEGLYPERRQSDRKRFNVDTFYGMHNALEKGKPVHLLPPLT